MVGVRWDRREVMCDGGEARKDGREVRLRLVRSRERIVGVRWDRRKVKADGQEMREARRESLGAGRGEVEWSGGKGEMVERCGRLIRR